MGIAILGTIFWGVFGPWLGLFLFVLGIISFAIAMQYVDRIHQQKRVQKSARRAFFLWGLSVIWTVIWVWMFIISLINWINFAN